MWHGSISKKRKAQQQQQQQRNSEAYSMNIPHGMFSRASQTLHTLLSRVRDPQAYQPSLDLKFTHHPGDLNSMTACIALSFQVFMLRACRVFEPRYRRLVKCCQETNGCFALACYGVGISAMFDRVYTEEDASNSVTIRGGRRFLVQEGSARVVPGTFGLTVVEPTYIYVRLCLAQVHPACSLLHVLESSVAV